MKNLSKFFIPAVYVGIICVMVLSVMLVVSGIKSFLNEEDNYKYTLDDVFEEDILPVVKTNSDLIIKPYVSDKVKIGKNYYDYESTKDKQESSLIMYKNTYMKNKGIDYVSDEDFDVVSILDGEVISIEDNEVYGKVLTIKHNDNLQSVYCNIKDVLVSVGYKTSQGEIIASSSGSELDKKNKSLLHFEVINNGKQINPEKVYSLNVSELK